MTPSGVIYYLNYIKKEIKPMVNSKNMVIDTLNRTLEDGKMYALMTISYTTQGAYHTFLTRGYKHHIISSAEKLDMSPYLGEGAPVRLYTDGGKPMALTYNMGYRVLERAVTYMNNHIAVVEVYID